MGGIAGTTVPLTKSKHSWGCALRIARDASRVRTKIGCSASDGLCISRDSQSRSAACTQLVIVIVIVVVILAAACEEHDQCQSETSNQSDDPQPSTPLSPVLGSVVPSVTRSSTGTAS